MLYEFICCIIEYTKIHFRVLTVPDGTENGMPLDESDTKDLLMKLIREVHNLNQKFDSMVELGGKILKTQEELLQKTTEQNHTDETMKLEPDMMTLLSLPNSLKKTVMALYKLGDATAEDLARETKRLRPVESSAANQLVRMGFLRKRREGRNVVFYIE